MNSSGETRKTIVINEGFIDPNGTIIHSSSKRKSPANRTMKNIKPSPQSKEISKQVLQKIRDRYKNIPLATTGQSEPEPQQEHIGQSSIQNPVVNEENRDLVQSIDFLERLTKNVQSRPPNPTNYEANPQELHRCYTPQYGCLKRGMLPTYRTLLNTTQKYRPINHHTPSHYPPSHYTPTYHTHAQTQPPSHTPTYHTQPPTHPVYSSQQLNQPIQYLQQGVSGQSPVPIPHPPFLTQSNVGKNGALDQEIKDLSIRHQFAEMKQEEMPTNNNLLQSVVGREIAPPLQNYQKRTVRRTHRVGRSKRLPVVSVLLPNKTIRSKVSTHSKTLKTLPMPQVKNSLVKTGMIKIGSDAPENVLREIYENMCLIGGPVMNYNPDVLYYNMLHNS